LFVEHAEELDEAVFDAVGAADGDVGRGAALDDVEAELLLG
jgi:hypothetical protein